MRPDPSTIAALSVASMVSIRFRRQPDLVSRGLLAALASTKRGERLVVQWLLGPARSPRPIATGTRSSMVEPWWQPLFGNHDRRLDADRRRALQEKHADHAFACTGRVGVT